MGRAVNTVSLNPVSTPVILQVVLQEESMRGSELSSSAFLLYIYT